MRKLKLYLDTSVWNFYYADDVPEKKEVTIQFFENLMRNNYVIYISAVVTQEIEDASEEKRAKLTGLINTYQPKALEVDEEIEDLADIYIRERIIPTNKRNDALHIAISTVNELDALISWNYKHLANLTKKELVRSVNIAQGFLKELEMITPMEVMTNE